MTTKTPSGSETIIELENFLPYRLSVLANVVSRTLAEDYSRRFDLSVGEWRVMAVLARFPNSSANQVAELSAMDKVRVSRSVSRLLNANRLVRDTDPEDRRRSVLRLSEGGQQIYKAITPTALDYEASVLQALSSQEQSVFFALMDKLSARANELEESSNPVTE